RRRKAAKAHATFLHITIVTKAAIPQNDYRSPFRCKFQLPEPASTGIEYSPQILDTGSMSQ
ncbi:MAG TPA: hypothetical protein PLC15_24965, partial [Candidatus Obscuribacter sp.]|nr:hypothetical protein [Candidatus Obscuribacter sp.]